MDVRDRVLTLQTLLRKNTLDAYVVPTGDPHQSEYVAEAWKRREYMSGFSGSAGLFASTQNQAGLWTDGRYVLQAEGELKGTGIFLFRQGEPGVPDWLEWMAAKLPRGGRLGINLSLFSVDSYALIEQKMKAAGIELVPQETDLVDLVWASERPPFPQAPLRLHSLSYAGVEVNVKLSQIRAAMAERGAQSFIVSALDEVAWLLNLRGADVAYNPVFYAYALITPEQAILFVDQRKVNRFVRDEVGASVAFADYESFPLEVPKLAAKSPVWLDPSTTSESIRSLLARHDIPVLLQNSPLPAWKAVKNRAELEGMRMAHVRDGVAMVRFLAWLDREVEQGHASLSEISVAEQLHRIRSESPEYLGPSFTTIAGYGAHGAMPHYRATAKSNSQLKAPGMFLLDSGGQYKDGTTDITRTVTLGQPTALHKQIYTTVLKGHLLLARSLFPEGTNGYQLDVLARQPLWAQSLNFGHGTGHGVGAALCVHEGPFSVSTRKNMTPLSVGHVLSNEPGCYLPGDFGVRIENLVTVVEKGSSAFGRFLGFENLTLCPYDRRLINGDLLTSEERQQIDDYHQQVFEKLEPYLSKEEKPFLAAATTALRG